MPRLLFLIIFFIFSNIVYADFLTEEYNESSGSYQSPDNYVSEFPPTYSYQEPEAEPVVHKRTVHRKKRHNTSYENENYENNYNLPSQITTNEKVIIVDPKVHAFGAYSSNGRLLRSGLATSGSKWCRDLGRSCKTSAGAFRIYSLGDSDCISSKYPLGEGGAPMPYCMYFNGSQGLHGSYQVVRGNVSHGCVRLRVSDAEWLRFNFVTRGTKVIIRPY